MDLTNLIYLSTGLCLSSLVWVSMLRRHLRNQQTIRRGAAEIESRQRLLDETRAALREVYNRVYHKEIFPDICRTEGCINLQIIMLEDAIRNAEIASRDEYHFRYNALVLKKLIEVRDINARGQGEIRRLKDRFQSIMAQFEHLQE